MITNLGTPAILTNSRVTTTDDEPVQLEINQEIRVFHEVSWGKYLIQLKDRLYLARREDFELYTERLPQAWLVDAAVAAGYRGTCFDSLKKFVVDRLLNRA